MGKKANKPRSRLPAKQARKDESEKEESEIQPEVMAEEKPVKKAAKKAQFDLQNIFSESFRGRLTQYIALNSQVLSLKAKEEGTNNSDEIEERKNKMAERVQNTAADILRLQLQSLEEWIGEQQVHLSNDIVKLGKVYDENKANLNSTKCFSREEIEAQVEPIQTRSNEKQKAYDDFGELIRRSKNIYS